MSACSSCGQQLREGAKFCGSCGAGAPPQDIPACPNCGARVQAEWVFCGSCGQSAVGTLPFAESAGMPGGATNRRILQAGLAAGLVVLVAAGGVFAWRFLGGSDDGTLHFAAPPKVDRAIVAALDQRFASLPHPAGENDRDQVRDLMGIPDAFIISWESIGAEPEPVRYETWFYYELLSAFEFADGQLISNLPIDDEEAVLLLPRQYDPSSFARELDWKAVSAMLPDPASAATTTVPEELGVALTAYAGDQLLVVFDEFGLVYVETILLRGQTP